MWDLVDNPDSITLIESFYNSGKPVAAVYHSPAVFHRVMHNGVPLVNERQAGDRLYQRRRGSCTADSHVPFLVEDELKRVGGLYEFARLDRPRFIDCRSQDAAEFSSREEGGMTANRR